MARQPKRNWEQEAAKVWPVLVRAAARRTFLTYSDISKLIDTSPIAVRYVLEPIQEYCRDTYPILTSIVVRKDSGTPGSGSIVSDSSDIETEFSKVFHFDWAALGNPFAGGAGGETTESLIERLIAKPETAGDVYALLTVRGHAQRVFRDVVLRCYDYRCCMCGFSFSDTLESAHIIPWNMSDPRDRLNIRNGLLLCPNHHKMYDLGIISVGRDYKIEYYDIDAADGDYSPVDRSLSIDLHGKKIALPENPMHWPDPDALAERRVLDGWEGPCDE